jgi:hypothetical protein
MRYLEPGRKRASRAAMWLWVLAVVIAFLVLAAFVIRAT